MDQKEKEIKQAKNAAYRYLTIRSRSRREIEKKLSDRGFPADTVRSVLAHLDHLGYVNDASFARQWAANRQRTSGFGRLRIERELRAKGIDRDIVRETLESLVEEHPEADTARREAEKKRRTMDRLEPVVRRRRLAGFLERKGYSSETIRAVLRDVCRSD